MKRTWLVPLVACSAIALFPAHAGAQSAADLDRAKTLFNTGAQFYTGGDFESAIKAFEEANRILPKPAIDFSIAQAHRRQYYIDKKPEHLRAAVDAYKKYIAEVPEGGRKFEASQALGELELLQARVGDTGGPSASGPSTAKEAPHLMVSSPTSGAQVAVDQKAPHAAPFGMDLTPGKHHVKVMADGYFSDERDVLAEGGILPLSVELREKPGHLVIEGTKGAEISIDGRPAGETPLPTPIEVTSGRHFVVVTKNGHKAFTQEFEIKRDERKVLRVDLDVTGQRLVAYTVLLTGGALLVTSGVFVGVALAKQGKAQDILDKRDQGSITTDDLSRYESLRDQRDTWVRLSGITLGAAAAALGTGVVLYAFDRPTVSPPPQRFDEAPAKKPASPTEPIEMSMVPMVSPGFAGGSVFGRF